MATSEELTLLQHGFADESVAVNDYCQPALAKQYLTVNSRAGHYSLE